MNATGSPGQAYRQASFGFWRPVIAKDEFFMLGYLVTSFPASETIPPGRLVQVRAGRVQLAQGVPPLTGIVGVSLYVRQSGGASFSAGDLVPILRRGLVLVETTGTPPDLRDAANVNHPSSADPLGVRGTFTIAPVSATAGLEVSTLNRSAFDAPGNPGVALLAINL